MSDYRNNNREEEPFRFSIDERIGVVAAYNNGWSKEVNIVNWNDRGPKIDIRDWDPAHNRMRKGVTLYREEAVEVVKILTRYLASTSEPEWQTPQPQVRGTNEWQAPPVPPVPQASYSLSA